MLHLFNTASKSIEEFTPHNPPHVSLYTCGMTVYDFAHIGHGRKYVGDDVLRRILTRFGYEVVHVQNVTDVGHLVSDDDDGEDKLEKGARKFGKTVWEVAAFFTKHFQDSMAQLNILTPSVVCKATDHIPEQIKLIERLLAQGHAYETDEAVYFDVRSFPRYGTLFGQKLEDKKTAVRANIETGEHKRNPADFSLWFKRVGRFADHAMHWESPWGQGFPGWHIECSAMSLRYLTDVFGGGAFDAKGARTIDIHTGGIEHTAVHHPNEIAQSEAATGVPFVSYWVHHGHLMMMGAKMSKSLGNVFSIEDIVKKGYDPLALRYFYFSANYRKPLNFTWEALTASQTALSELRRQLAAAKASRDEGKRTQLSEEKLERLDELRAQFDTALADDMNMPKALAVTWEAIKSNIPGTDKYELLLDFDTVLGLNLDRAEAISSTDKQLPEDIAALVQQRTVARESKDFSASDALRKEIEAKGYSVEDTPMGVHVKKKF